LDDSRCNTRNHWRFVDTHLYNGSVTMSRSLLSLKAADTLIMGKCCSIALGLYMMQYPRLLTLCWRSVDALLTLCWRSFFGVATTAFTILSLKPANTSIMGKSRSIALGLYKMQHPKLLTLCWRSYLGVATSTLTILPIKEANTLIMGKSRSTALGLYKMQYPKLLTHHWRTFSEWGCDHIAFSFALEGCQYVDYG